MSAAERRVHRGRSVVTRAALAREAGVSHSTAGSWYFSRSHNGHPDPVLAVGRLLYFDEIALLAWMDAQLNPLEAAPRIVRGGRSLVTRAELARLTGLSETVLRHLYANRGATGHPQVVHRDRKRVYFDERASLDWHAALGTGVDGPRSARIGAAPRGAGRGQSRSGRSGRSSAPSAAASRSAHSSSSSRE